MTCTRDCNVRPQGLICSGGCSTTNQFFRSKTALLENTLKLPKLKHQSSFATLPRCSFACLRKWQATSHVSKPPLRLSFSQSSLDGQTGFSSRQVSRDGASLAELQAAGHGGSWLRHQPWQGKQKWNILSFDGSSIHMVAFPLVGMSEGIST